MSYRIAGVVALGLAACVSSAHAQSNLITNGSFESPVPGTWQGSDAVTAGSWWTNAVAPTGWIPAFMARLTRSSVLAR